MRIFNDNTGVKIKYFLLPVRYFVDTREGYRVGY